LRITLAVAGFTRDQLDVTTEENQLVIRGRQQDDKTRQYIHRGIAAGADEYVTKPFDEATLRAKLQAIGAI